jgi:hypothetical protein
MKYMLCCCGAGLILGVTVTAWADDTLILDKGKDSVVSGTVTDVRGDTVTIRNNNELIKIDLDSIDLDRSVSDLIQPGMEITAQGKFKDLGATPTFEAESILRNTTANGSSTAAAAALRANDVDIDDVDDNDLGDVDIKDSDPGAVKLNNEAATTAGTDAGRRNDDAVDAGRN